MAAVCRDHRGAYLGSSSVAFPGVLDPVTLETYACREVLALAEDLNLQKFVIASDCQEVINDINRGTGGPHAAIVHEIIGRQSSFQFSSFIHERRNHNFEAYKLAKFACNLDRGTHVWLGMPHNPTIVPMNIILE